MAIGLFAKPNYAVRWPGKTPDEIGLHYQTDGLVWVYPDGHTLTGEEANPDKFYARTIPGAPEDYIHKRTPFLEKVNGRMPQSALSNRLFFVRHLRTVQDSRKALRQARFAWSEAQSKLIDLESKNGLS